MEFKFDKKGYLTPYEVIFCDSIEALEYSFVTRFSSSLSRKRIYMGFLEYLFDMGNYLKRIGYQGTWKVWIDGSFVSQKTNPNDLDLLNILEDTPLFHVHRLSFEQFFAHHAKQNYEVDTYFLLLSDSEEVRALELYWREQFGKSRDESPKGFIEMSIQF